MVRLTVIGMGDQFKNVGCISAFLKLARNGGLVGDSLGLHLSRGAAFIAVTGRIIMIPHS
jgi:hypothetical protein